MLGSKITGAELQSVLRVEEVDGKDMVLQIVLANTSSTYLYFSSYYDLHTCLCYLSSLMKGLLVA